MQLFVKLFLFLAGCNFSKFYSMFRDISLKYDAAQCLEFDEKYANTASKKQFHLKIPAWGSIDKCCYVAPIGLMHSIVSFLGLFTSELTR